MRRTRIILVGLCVLMSETSFAADIIGQWQAENGKTRIEINPCDEALCGNIIWLKYPRKDVNNKDPELRNRDLVGIQVASNMRATGKNKWKGIVYSAKRGTDFDSSVKLSGDTLTIKGCLSSAGFLCKKVKYNRYKP